MAHPILPNAGNGLCECSMTYRQSKVYNRAKYLKTYLYSLFHSEGLPPTVCDATRSRNIVKQYSSKTTWKDKNVQVLITLCVKPLIVACNSHVKNTNTIHPYTTQAGWILMHKNE